jgi:hypothetical protein
MQKGSFYGIPEEKKELRLYLQAFGNPTRTLGMCHVSWGRFPDGTVLLALLKELGSVPVQASLVLPMVKKVPRFLRFTHAHRGVLPEISVQARRSCLRRPREKEIGQ